MTDDLVKQLREYGSCGMVFEAASRIEKLEAVTKDDAKWLAAYHKWCEMNGCAPSSSDLISARKALEGKMIEWQPIETAPKDIGAIIGSNGQWVLAMRWATNGMAWTSEYHRSAVVPTHWMPLPNPPKEKK